MVTAIVSQVDGAATLDEFWRNFHLRGPAVYDPSGTIGGTVYQQPYGGIPFSRAWVITQDQRVALAQFGHHPDRVIETIHGLLHEEECDGPVSLTCVGVEWEGGDPRLRLDKGLCPPGAPAGPFDVVRGRVGRLRTLGGMVDLGPVDCVASELTVDRVLDVSPVALDSCVWGGAIFYLARPSSADDFGTASGGERRSEMQPQPPCP